jgi:tight adherence protein B
MLWISLLLVAVGIGCLGYQAYLAFSEKAEDYEARYLAGADRELSRLFAFVTPRQLWRMSLASAAAGSLPGLWAGLRVGPIPGAALAAALGVTGFFAPRLVVTFLAIRRQATFMQQFPDAIGMIGNGLKAGLSLLQAIEMVAREMPNPVAQEFGLLFKDRQLGRSTEEAMDRLSARMPLQDVRIFVMVAKLSLRMGGDVTEAFSRVAETIRNRFTIEKKVKALTAEARMQAIFISVMPFAMAGIMWMMAPDMMRPLFETGIWAVLLVVIVILEIVGGLAMWKCAQVKY